MEGEILNQIGGATTALVLGLGLSVGLEHALEPDHVAAVGTGIPGPRGARRAAAGTLGRGVARSSLLGAAWGAGHTTTLVLMGMLVYVAALGIRPSVFDWLELGAGAMLVALGVAALLNRSIPLPRLPPAARRPMRGRRSYVIGLVHGLAGSGALAALAAASAGDAGTVLWFVLALGAGSAAGMAALACLMGLPVLLSGGADRVRSAARIAAGVFSVAAGAYVVYGIWGLPGP